MLIRHQKSKFADYYQCRQVSCCPEPSRSGIGIHSQKLSVSALHFLTAATNKPQDGSNVGLSRPRDFHPQPLQEPDVNLSAHPAPITQATRKNPKMPVNEEMRMGTGNAVEVMPRPLPMPGKSFEFPPHPLHKIPVEVPPQLTQCRRVESTIIGLPTL